MAEQKLHYALRDGQLVSIDNVERGLQCNCVCPSCGAALIARKGDKREHHFAHYGDTDCSGGVETALHLLAKKLLCSTKTVFVPGIDRESKGSVKTFLSAEPEIRDYSSFIPDIVLRNKTEALAIEILVTHAVDEGKAGRIKEAQLPTIEIDLSGQIEIYNERTVLKAILSGESTEWIYHPILEAREKEECVREELCDYLPPICDISKPYYKCPKIKRTVSVLSHCSECPYYLGIGDPSGYETYHDILCAYRLRDVPIAIVKDIRNIERSEDGYYISADLLMEEGWVTHSPKYDESVIISPRESVSLLGEKLTNLKNLRCKKVVVRNLVNDDLWVIKVSYNGQLHRANYAQGIIQGERVIFDKTENKYHYYYKERRNEFISDVGDPVWEIIKKI